MFQVTVLYADVPEAEVEAELLQDHPALLPVFNDQPSVMCYRLREPTTSAQARSLLTTSAIPVETAAGSDNSTENGAQGASAVWGAVRSVVGGGSSGSIRPFLTLALFSPILCVAGFSLFLCYAYLQASRLQLRLSSRVLRIQRLLLRSLVAQTLSFCLFIAAPFLALLAVFLFRPTYSNLAWPLAQCVFSLHAFTDSLSLVLVVAPYRRYLLNLFRRAVGARTADSSAAVSATSWTPSNGRFLRQSTSERLFLKLKHHSIH